MIRTTAVRVSRANRVDPGRLELFLEIADIVKRVSFLRALIPARIKGQHIFIKHAMKQTDFSVAIRQNKPILIDVSAHFGEAERFVKDFGLV